MRVFMCHLRCLAQHQNFPSKSAERRSIRARASSVQAARSRASGVGGRLVKFSLLRSGRAPRNSAESPVTRAAGAAPSRRGARRTPPLGANVEADGARSRRHQPHNAFECAQRCTSCTTSPPRPPSLLLKAERRSAVP